MTWWKFFTFFSLMPTTAWLVWGAIMLHPQRNIPTYTKHSLNILVTLTIYYCDLDPVTFYYCDTFPPIWCHVNKRTPLIKVGCFVTVLGCPPLFYLDYDKTSTFALNRNVDVCCMSQGLTGKCIGLVGGGWMKCHNCQNQGLIMGHTEAWISWMCALT
jgi:hypothetical protein